MKRIEEGFRIGELIGSSGWFLAEARKIPLMARCGSCVFISGEPGTGKESCARTIHDLGSRADKPFVLANCAALAAGGAEVELFGHGGSGSVIDRESRRGVISDAAGGTLFLDEIDRLPLPAQVRVLRTIQEGAFPGAGCTGEPHARVRVIAATNGDPLDAVKAGKLRQDLYAQLNVLSLRIVPLRERGEDILPLARHFVKRFCRAMTRPPSRLSDETVRKLLLHPWPGNVRELEQVIERAVALSGEQEITETAIVFASGEPDAGMESFREAKARFVEEFEKRYIEKLLLIHRGNISRAARTAQKDRRAFWELIRKHGIDADRYRESRPPSLNAVI
jgi:two-component system, NtrC family, response regulator GlrR